MTFFDWLIRKLISNSDNLFQIYRKNYWRTYNKITVM